MKPDQPKQNKKKPMWVALWPCLGLLCLFLPRANQSEFTRSMGITQKLGDTIPKSIPFTDENGKKVTIGDMFQGRPVCLVPIFYSCKTGCAILTDSIYKTIAQATKDDILAPGRDMDIVMYSIDPKEDSELAAAKKAAIFSAIDPHFKSPEQTDKWMTTARGGWHLLTGTMDSIQKLSSAIGFKYAYKAVPDLEKRKKIFLIDHPTCTVFLSPEAKISSYTIGNEFEIREAQADTLVASRDEVGHHADQSWMFGCIMIDPATGRNRVVVENVWRLGGVLTLIALIGGVVSMSLKSKHANLNGGGSPSLR